MTHEATSAFTIPNSFPEKPLQSPVKKQGLSSEEISHQNIRGYAGLIQDVFDFYDTTEVSMTSSFQVRRKNLAQAGNTKDPLARIGIYPSNTRELVESVEMSLATLPPRLQEVVRLRFRLDEQGGSLMTFKEIGEQVKDKTKQKPIASEQARQLFEKGITWLRHPNRSTRLRQRLLDNPSILHRFPIV